jgi:2-dehydropantoate 2-reductase
MRLVVLGAGAIGGAIGGLLSRAGRQVVLLSRGAQLDAIRSAGLRVETPDGPFTVHPETADSAEPFAWRDGDALGVAVKTQDVAAALATLAPPPWLPIVCFTNGVEAERLALRHSDHVHGACVNMPATYLTLGVVQIWSAPVPGTIDVGQYPDGTGEHADDLAGELLVADLDARVVPRVMAWKRAKLLTNLANAIDALCADDVDDVEAAAIAEARACFAAAHLGCVGDAEFAARGRAIDVHAIDGTERGGGSTWQSLTRGRSLETDHLNGEIALLGRLHGIPTPVNVALQRLAAAAARAGLAPGTLSAADLRRSAT